MAGHRRFGRARARDCSPTVAYGDRIPNTLTPHIDLVADDLCVRPGEPLVAASDRKSSDPVGRHGESSADMRERHDDRVAEERERFVARTRILDSLGVGDSPGHER